MRVSEESHDGLCAVLFDRETLQVRRIRGESVGGVLSMIVDRGKSRTDAQLHAHVVVVNAVTRSDVNKTST